MCTYVALLKQMLYSINRSPPIICLGVSATKFLDEGTAGGSIAAFMSQKSSSSSSSSQAPYIAPDGKCDDSKSIKSFFNKQQSLSSTQQKQSTTENLTKSDSNININRKNSVKMFFEPKSPSLS